MVFEIVEAPKQKGQSKASAVAELRKARPGFRVVTFVEAGNVWKAELQERKSTSTREAEFPFEKDEESKDAPKAEESDDSDDDDDDDDEAKSEEKSDDDDGEEKGDDKEMSQEDALGRLKSLVGEIQGLFDELGGKAEEVASDADEKQKKLDEAHKVLSPDASPGGEGPVPGMGGGPEAPESLPAPGGKPPVGPGGAGPAAVGPAAGPRQRKTPRRPAPMAPSAFSNLRRRTEIANHPGVDENGNRITLTAAASALEAEMFKDYEVVSIKHDGDNIVAKLVLKS
jgi:hypothetical protein